MLGHQHSQQACWQAPIPSVCPDHTTPDMVALSNCWAGTQWQHSPHTSLRSHTNRLASLWHYQTAGWAHNGSTAFTPASAPLPPPQQQTEGVCSFGRDPACMWVEPQQPSLFRSSVVSTPNHNLSLLLAANHCCLLLSSVPPKCSAPPYHNRRALSPW